MGAGRKLLKIVQEQPMNRIKQWSRDQRLNITKGKNERRPNQEG